MPEHVQDIEDPNQLSLEEEKRRTTEEEKAQQVEEKKLLIQRNLASMKVQFRVLQQRSLELPRQFQVSEDHFRMTDFTYEEIEVENEQKLLAIKEANRGKMDESMGVMEKIKRRFFDDVQFPRIIVKGIRMKQELCSFRISCHQLRHLNLDESQEFKEKRSLENNGIVTDGKTDDSNWSREVEFDLDESSKAEEILSSFEKTLTLKEPLDHRLLDDRILKTLKKQEERKEKKLARRKKWDELFARKPKGNEEDTELEEEIARAKANVGQYIRRTSESFHDDQPISSCQQEQKLIRLMINIQRRKEEFNLLVLSTRAMKKSLLDQLEQVRNQLIQVQYNLEAEKRKPVPTLPVLHPEELQTDPFQLSEKEVEHIKSELEKESEALGFPLGGSGSGSRRSSMSSSVFRGAKQQLLQQARKMQQATDRWSPPPLEEDLEEESTEDDQQQITKTESENAESIEIRYLHEQNSLIQKMERMMETFDKELVDRINKRKIISVELKYSELSLIFLYEELQIIRTTEREDISLTEKVQECERTLATSDAQISQHERKVKSIEADLKRFAECLAATHETVSSELVDNKHAEHLTRLFHVKKCSAVVNASSSLSGEGGLEETAAAAAAGPQTHPAEISPAALKFVEEMRRRRDLLETCIKNEEKSLRKLQQVLHGLISRREHQHSTYIEAKRLLHQFRLRTQAQVNKIDVIFTLKMSQLPMMDSQGGGGGGGGSPADQADEPLVFAEEKWMDLKKRTEELKSERATHKQKFKEDRQVYLNLQEQCQQIKGEIVVLTKRCKEEMEKRFGKGISFADIEAFALNRTLEEMREGARRKEEEKYRQLEKKSELTKEEQRTLTKSILFNTNLLDQKTGLVKERGSLRRKKISLEELSQKSWQGKVKESDELMELRALQDLFHSQQLELADMQQRIARFMTKGAPLIRTEGLLSRGDIRERIASAKARIKLNGGGNGGRLIKLAGEVPSSSNGADGEVESVTQEVLVHRGTESGQGEMKERINGSAIAIVLQRQDS